MTKKIIAVIYMIVFLAGISAASLSYASDSNYGLDTTASNADIKSGSTDIPTRIGQILGTALSFVGVLFFILVIYGGVTYMLARGNSSEIDKAKDILIAATIGLVIVMAAYAITKYVSSTITASS